MESLLLEFSTLFIVALIGALTPGPDILFVLKNTLSGGFRAGFLSLAGIFLGWCLFLGLIYFGLSHIFSSNLAQGILSVIGGFYLSYLAYLLLFKSKNTMDFNGNLTINFKHLVLKGFLLNISNPKAILFFSIIIAPFMQSHLELSLIVLLFSLSFAFVIVIILGAFFKKMLSNRLFDMIDKACGILFIFFAILLFYTAFGALKPLI